MRIIYFVAAFFLAASLPGQAPALARPAADQVESGRTQVVARVGGHEITLSEMRVEMARLGLSPASADAERIAVERIVNRTLLAAAARKAELHRRPDAILQMRAAEEQALADLYLSIVSQPPEPTRQEIEDYIADNPSLFARRRVYDFRVLTMPTSAFDEAALTPLFDEAKDFAKLERRLAADKVSYSVSDARRLASSFPVEIREQLAAYAVSDNIVLKGPGETQIMKIMRARPSPAPSEEWPVIARRILLNENARLRAEKFIDRLQADGNIAYFRKSAAPAPASGDAVAAAGDDNPR